MAFGNSQDPRYRGNRTAYAFLFLLALVGVLIIGGLFWFRGGERVREATEKKTEASPGEGALPTPSLAASPTSPPSAESAKQERLKKLRAEMTESRDWAKVEALAHEILALEPEDSQGWSYVGRAQEAQGNLGEAMKAYERAANAPGRTYYDLYLKARLYRKLGEQTNAIATLEAARELKTDSVILSNLILIFQIQDGQGEAVRKLVKTYEVSEVQSNRDQWLAAAAALALHDGNKEKAMLYLQRFRNLVKPEIYRILIADAFFDPYRLRYPEVFSGEAQF